jgi:hypothetical protein
MSLSFKLIVILTDCSSTREVFLSSFRMYEVNMRENGSRYMVFEILTAMNQETNPSGTDAVYCGKHCHTVRHHTP